MNNIGQLFSLFIFIRDMGYSNAVCSYKYWPTLVRSGYLLYSTYVSVWSHRNSKRMRYRSLEHRWHDVPVTFWSACLWLETMVIVPSKWPNAGLLHNWVTDAPDAHRRFQQLRVGAWKTDNKFKNKMKHLS